MLSRYQFKIIDRTLNHIQKSGTLFNKKLLILEHFAQIQFKMDAFSSRQLCTVSPKIQVTPRQQRNNSLSFSLECWADRNIISTKT